MATNLPTILETAGVSPKQYGTEISLATLGRSVFLTAARRYQFAPGETFFIPKISARVATVASAETDGDKLQPIGADLTFDAIAGTKAPMLNTWAYNGTDIAISSLEAMAPANVRATIDAITLSAAEALANKIDSDILAAYATWNTTNSVVDATTYTFAKLLQAIGVLRSQNAPTPYFIVAGESLWDDLAGTPELNQWNYRGAPPENVTPQMRGAVSTRSADFTYRAINIYTTSNVSFATNYKAIAFSGEAIALAIRSMVGIREAFDIRTMSQKLVAYSDYATATVQFPWIVPITHS